MTDESLPPGYVLDEPLPHGYVLDEPLPDDYRAEAASPSLTSLAGQLLPGHAAVAKSVIAPAQYAAKNPTEVASGLASLAASAATGGASIPVQMGMQALGLGGVEAYRQLATRILGGDAPQSAWEAIKGMFTATAPAVATTGTLGMAGKAVSAMAPTAQKVGAQMIRATAAVPEKYGRAVLADPSILSQGPTMAEASAAYKAAVKGATGAREFLQQQTGDILLTVGDAVRLVKEATPKLAKGALGINEALAARQSVSFLLQAAKYGNPEMRANLAALVKAKDGFDNLLESSLPGFKVVSRGYFEANAKEAFQSLLPQNKNLSPNVLRSLGSLASLGGAAVLHTPYLLFSAAAASPLAIGSGIRAGAAVGRAAFGPESASITKAVAAIFGANRRSQK